MMNLLVASDELRGAGNDGRSFVCSRCRVGGLLYGCNKTVTALGDRLNEPRFPGVIIQDLPELQYVGAQHLRLHIGFRPQGIKQFIMGNQSPGIVNQVAQNRKRLTGKSDLCALMPEALNGSVQRKRLELLHSY